MVRGRCGERQVGVGQGGVVETTGGAVIGDVSSNSINAINHTPSIRSTLITTIPHYTTTRPFGLQLRLRPANYP